MTLCIYVCTYIIFLQIKLYAEVGDTPKAWDLKQKGSTTLDPGTYDYYDYDFVGDIDANDITEWVSNSNTLFDLCLTEYVFVSLSLALVIAKFFPAIHSRLVSRATSLEYQSLYWGAAVVSNVFVYGLVFLSGRALSLLFVHFTHPTTGHVALATQVIIYGIFFCCFPRCL